MSNYAYLCCSDLNRIYPSFENPDFDPEVHTLACDVEAIPLLWLALFRAGDMRDEVFDSDGQKIHARAPLAERSVGISQLEQAVPVLNTLFKGWGSLDEHAEFLKTLLNEAEGRYVTIELEEVAVLYDEDEFYKMLDKVLSFLTTSQGDPGHIRNLILALSQYEKSSRQFPPARGLVDVLDLSEEEEWNLVRILGASHIRIVPWE